MKVCSEVLVSSGRDTLMNYIQKHMRHYTRDFDMSRMLNESKYSILTKKTNFLDDSSHTKSWIMDHAYSEKPFLAAVRGKMNSTGPYIGILQNMIVGATLMDGIEIRRNSLDAVLGETATEIMWRRTYHPSSVKVRPSLFIQTSTNNAHKGYNKSSMKSLHHNGKYLISKYPIQ